MSIAGPGPIYQDDPSFTPVPGNSIFEQITCTATSLTACSRAFSLDNSYQLALNAVYGVAITAGISNDGVAASMSAYVDPYFTVPTGYSLVLSDGIGNALIAGTPLPAALPLFGAGLGVIGLLGWRRNRKMQVTI
jgi:hypothetical protein